MAMYEYSRYRYCTVLTADDGVTKYLDEREPFRFSDESDNRFYITKEGDTWWGIAWRFFRAFRHPSLLWWLLCEFQPEPVVDPTIVIPPGSQIVVPSERLVRNHVFSRENRRYHH